MRVLLVKPGRIGHVGLDRTALVEPLGIEMVAASIPDQEVRILDLRVERGAERALEEFQPDACGIGCSFTTEVYRSLALARLAKGRLGDCFVFVGGHHPSLRPDDFADPAVDAVVVGEAEPTVPELVEALAGGRAIETVRGLVLNRPGGQLRTAERPLVADLDELPLPARRLVAGVANRYYMGFHRPHALLETSRGCPYRCKFCSVWKYYGGRVRRKSPQRVVAELAEIRAPHVFVTDDNFFSDVERAHEIADLVKAEGIHKSYTFQARTDTISRNPDLIAHWMDAGRVTVFVGIEAIDQHGLEEVRKKSSIEHNERALDILQESGIGFSGNFIVSPEAGRREFRRLRAYVLRRGLHSASFSVLTPLPGTDLFEEEKGRLTTDNYELFDLFHAVTPTRLPLPDFYEEFASLWSTARSAGASRQRRRLWKLVKALATGRTGLSSLRLGMDMARTLSDPETYMLAHEGRRGG